MSEKSAEIVIIGSELSGLITGAFLAKRGLSVLVLNPDHEVDKKEKNIRPHLISHLNGRLFKTILGRLSIHEAELGILNRYDTPYQVVLPDHRIDVAVSREKLQRELKREFPDQAEGIRSFYLSLDELEETLDSLQLQELILPQTLREKIKFFQFIRKNHLNLTVSDWMKNLQLNGEISSFLDAQIKFLSSFHYSEYFSYPLAKLLANQNSTLFELRGGMGQLKKILLNKIELFGGQVRHQVKIESLISHRRVIKGVELGGFEGKIGCRFMLWNQPNSGLSEKLPPGLFSKWLSHKINPIQPALHRFSIQYEIPTEFIPVGMRNNLLWIRNPEQPLLGSNFLHLQFYSPPHANEDRDKQLLTITYILKKEELERQESFFDSIHEEILKTLPELFPFSEGKINFVFPQKRDVSDPPEFLFSIEESDFERFKQNAKENPIYQIRPRFFWNLFPFPHRTVFKNFYLTGPEILASFGFEGELILGIKTTESIWNSIEKQQKVRKRRKA